MKKPDKERLEAIVKTWKQLQEEIEERHISRDDLQQNNFIQWAVNTPIYYIGEQVYQMSPEIKEKYPDVKWKVVSGLRHHLVHDYENTDWSIIADIIFGQMEVFINQIEQILSEM